MPKKFLTAQSATFKVLPADTGIAKAIDDPMGVKGLNPFHDLMAGFVKVDAEGQPYTVGVLPDTVSILGSDTILIAEDPSDTFTFSIVDPLQLTGLGIGTPGEAGTVKFTGTGNVKTAGGDYEATETISAGAGVSGTQFVWNLADFSGAPVVRNLNFALSPTISLSPTDGTGDVDLGRVGEPWGTGYINTLTRDAGDLTLSTTTSGNISLNASDANGNISVSGIDVSLTADGVLTLTNQTQANQAILFQAGNGENAIGEFYGSGEIVFTSSADTAGFSVNSAESVFSGSVSASSYTASGSPGIDTTITTGSLVGKTITITGGLITGFA